MLKGKITYREITDKNMLDYIHNGINKRILKKNFQVKFPRFGKDKGKVFVPEHLEGSLMLFYIEFVPAYYANMYMIEF